MIRRDLDPVLDESSARLVELTEDLGWQYDRLNAALDPEFNRLAESQEVAAKVAGLLDGAR